MKNSKIIYDTISNEFDATTCFELAATALSSRARSIVAPMLLRVGQMSQLASAPICNPIELQRAD